MNRFSVVVVLLIGLMSGGSTRAQSPGSTAFTLIAEQDTLTMVLPSEGVVSLVDLAFEVVIDGRRTAFPLADYMSFAVLRLDQVPTPLCLRLEREGSNVVVPEECRNTPTLREVVPPTGVFWHDARARVVRPMLIVGGRSFVVCPGAPVTARCELIYQAPAAPPSFATPTIPAPTDTPAPTATETPTPTETPTRLLATATFTRTRTPSATPFLRFIRTSGDNAVVRAEPNRTATVVTTLPNGSSIRILETVSGASVNGNNTWYRLALNDGRSGFVHSSVTIAPGAPTPISGSTSGAPTRASTAAPGATAAGNVCVNGAVSGSASGLFSFDGKRRIPIYLNAGQPLSITLSITNGSGDYGVGLVITQGGAELFRREIYDESQLQAQQFGFAAPNAGTYSLEVWGDSTHTYSYALSWSCG